MQVRLAYLGRSEFRESDAGQTLSLAPNLDREPVAFDAELLRPLAFREAISALHAVVLSDLRFKKRDKTAYLRWKAQEEQRRQQMRAQVRQQVMAAAGAGPVPPELERAYRKARSRYWDARRAYADHLRRHDVELWRTLMPYDPVVTVADDVVFFECFSADGSSYGCLTAERGRAFGPSSIPERLGTTNVDYSQALYDHFQGIRSYRPTRLRVDPAGFEVAVAGKADHREEKIDLPPPWLRGFAQVQAAMALASFKVTLSRESAYSILAFLRRHRREQSPRAIRFELTPGEAPGLVLEPWEVRINAHGCPPYAGPPTAPIRIWGRRRLLSLARLLPLAERFDVHLLGTGLPSFWVAEAGELRLTLGLSSWTTNDWTAASALDLVAPPQRASPDQLERVRAALRAHRSCTLEEAAREAMTDAPTAAAALLHLARTGQAIRDLSAGVFRFRQILPRPIGDADLGPEHPELEGARRIMAERPVRLEAVEDLPGGGVVLRGEVDRTPVELLIDADRNARRGKCLCGYYRKYLLRNGPCRHMIVLRRLAEQRVRSTR